MADRVTDKASAVPDVVVSVLGASAAVGGVGTLVAVGAEAKVLAAVAVWIGP